MTADPASRSTAEARWPAQVQALCAALARTQGAERETARARLWSLVHDALSAAIDRMRRQQSWLSAEDAADLASEKASVLLARAERGEWDPAGRASGEVVNYLAMTARHGVLHLAEKRRRTVPLEALDDGSGGMLQVHESTCGPLTPERVAELRDLARGLIDCLSHLQPRARRVWFMRAFHEMSSHEIATHPEVNLTTPNVDVILKRSRESLTPCLSQRGLDSRDLPDGAFALLWSWLAGGSDTAGLTPEARLR